ncbi:phosphotriesterase family protein [Effusibacillus pohliae]|uniref:phosphotriesterase family protein n=1 Tax=Effusibacillus pohliae TaxID=232270 RepID=UPI000368E8B8|nr:phosphotriesterase-related protein [Effusibacillus pohliae]
MTRMVNTVTGPVSVDHLGKTLIHEHFVFGYPGFQGDTTLAPYDREAALQVGIHVAERLKAHGVKTVVDPTPNECGRDPELLREISERTGIQIICATGYYYEGESATAYFKFRAALGDAETEIYEMFMREITEGIGRSGIKPGIIKLASSKDRITDYERMFFRAAARAQKETGITIVTHTQEGTMGPEQAELLVSLGADPDRIVIGHMCGNTDVSYHLRTLKHGVNIAFDRFGIQGMVGAPMDEERVTVLLGLLGKGYGDKIMLAHDTVNFWLGRPLVLPEPVQQLMANWHPTHLFENILPALRQAGISEELIDTLFVENPKRLFGGKIAAQEQSA